MTSKRVSFKDRERWITTSLGREPWIEAYLWQEEDTGTVELFSAFVPTKVSKSILRDVAWDVSPGEGLSIEQMTYTLGQNGRRETRKYLRYGNEREIQPLVILRQFSGIKPESVEVLEEFRLFHNLYHDPETNRYIKINSSADDEDIIRLGKDSVEIRTDALIEFLQAKKVNLVLYFRFSQQEIMGMDATTATPTREVHRGKELIYLDVSLVVPQGPVSVLLEGKKLIRPPRRRRNRSHKKYETFIFAVDAQGKERVYTCDPGRLANYFGANPDAPQYTRPIFFQREVLTKYYSNSKKYSVQDGYVSCGQFWGIRIDNNHHRYLIAMLGDLGRDLPTTEQKYWRSFNVRPDGGLSAVSLARDFLCEFAKPSQPDLIFRETYESFQRQWKDKFGWYFFNPLSDPDAHFFSKVHIPFTTEQSEFDEQVEALNKVLVESLNDAELLQRIPHLADGEQKPRSIEKLQRFLEGKGLPDYEPHIIFLRWLYRLRHGTPHRKGEEYRKAAEHFQVHEQGHIASFAKILNMATALLNYLRDKCITSTGSQM